MFISSFYLSVLLIMLYGVLATLTPSGVSTGKIIVSLLPWVAFILSLYYYLRNYRRIKKRVPPVPFAIINLLLITNLVNVGRSIVDAESTITTALGNPYSALALLAPFALGFGTNPRLLAAINQQLRYFVLLGTLVLFYYFFVNFDRVIWLDIALPLLSQAIFLIPLLIYFDGHNRTFIIVSNGLWFMYYGVIIGSRATVLRYSLVAASTLLVAFSNRRLGKPIQYLVLGIALIPVVLIAISINSNQSVFDITTQHLRTLTSQEYQFRFIEKADTRTFLYTEVYDDLISSNSLIFGKGGSGNYFSSYFQLTQHDNSVRLTVEVGFLALLLKGGLLAVFLNYAVFITAIYYAIAHSANRYVKFMGVILAVHVLILFAENMLAYNLYNFTIWFIVGACLSTDTRSMSDTQLKNLLTWSAPSGGGFGRSNPSALDVAEWHLRR